FYQIRPPLGMMTKIFNEPDCFSRFFPVENIFAGLDPVRQDPENVMYKLPCRPDARDLFPALYAPDRVVILEYIIVCYRRAAFCSCCPFALLHALIIPPKLHDP